MIGDFIKIVAVIIIASVLVVLLKNRLAEYSFLLIVATVWTAILLVGGYIFPQIQRLQNLF